MAGIKDYSTTQINNSDLNGISVAEGMLPSNLNNAIRALMKNTREWFNDSQWVEYGDGDGAYTAAYGSATSFTIAGVDVTPIYHEGRRIKLIASTPGTIYGTISSSTFSTNTTVNVTWDSGSLSNEAITNVYIGALSKTNNSLPTGVIATATLADGSVTTIKIAADAVNGSKIADDSIDSEHYVDASIDTQHIADLQITNAKLGAESVNGSKIADDSIDSEHYVDGSIDTQHIGNLQVTNAKLGADSVNGSKIANDSIDSEHYVDSSIDTNHIANSQITTSKIADDNITTSKILNSNVTADKLATDSVVEAKIQNSAVTTNKINNDAVTIDKIADAVIVTNAEASGHTPDDVTFLTTSASDSLYFRQDSSETIASGDTWSGSDSYIATTAAIDDRIIDLVDDVGGFFPISSETNFPNTNPDVNDGAGTIVSIKEMGTTRTPSGGTVTIAGGTVGGSTVTITGCGSTVLTAGFGVLVETTTTLNTYTFHRLVPKATEVTTVAAISSDITTVAGDTTDIGVVSGLSSDIQSLADIEDGTVATDAISNVGNNISSVVTTASNISGVNSFADRYRISSSAPTTSLDSGDLYFDTTTNILNVYGASGWQNAGSSVNGTSQRYNYTATSGQTTFTGSDNNGNTLAYDAGYIDVYLNGVKLLNGTDVTVTSGSSVVLASGATTGDVVDIVAYGTFSVASLNADNLTSGTVPDARITGAYTGITNLTIDTNTGDANNPFVNFDNNDGNIGQIRMTSSGDFGFRANTGGTGNMLFETGGNSERLRIDSSGNLLLNTSSASGFDSAGLPLLVGNGSAHQGLTIYTGTSHTGAIHFADGTGTGSYRGQINYRHDTDILQIAVAGSEKMRIDSSGNLLVGTTSNNKNITGASLGQAGDGYFTRNDTPLYLNRLSADGEILRFSKDGTTVGSISCDTSQNLTIQGKASSDFSLLFGTNKLNPKNYAGTGAKDNAVDLGDNDDRFKDLYLGGGLYVGGTGTANKLDDYEEGLHTVTCTDSGGGATITMNTSFDQLAYTKIGRVVHLSGTLLFSSISGSFTGALQISIPFTVGNFADSSGRTTISVGVYNVDFTAGTYAFLDAGEGNNSLTLRTGGDNINTGQGRPDSSAQIYIGGSYITDA